MLLSNPEAASFIRNETIPYWESVSPVPKVTIDFGGGRVLKRTLTGNTVIYLCLPDGRVLDALPGVYAPAHFLGEIKKSLKFMRESGGQISAEDLSKWHLDQFSLAYKSEQMRTTMSKAMVESPLLNALRMRVRDERPSPIGANPNFTRNDAVEMFEKLSSKLEDISKQPAAVDKLRAESPSLSKTEKLSPEELGKLAVLIDSRTNISIVRPAVHLLFTGYKDMPSLSDCRDDVYKRILHIPIDDPYFGLADALVPGSPKE